MLTINQTSTNLYSSYNYRKTSFKAGMSHEALIAKMNELTKDIYKAEGVTGKYRKNFLDTLCSEISRAFSKRKKAPLLASLKELFSEQEKTINENAETLSGLKDGLFSQNKTLLETVKEQKTTIDTLTTSNSKKDETIKQLESKKDKTIADLQQIIDNLKAELTKKDAIISGKRPYKVNDKDLGELLLTEKGAKQYMKLVTESSNATAKSEQIKQYITEAVQFIDAHKYCSSAGYTCQDTVNETFKKIDKLRNDLAVAEGERQGIKSKMLLLKSSGELPE